MTQGIEVPGVQEADNTQQSSVWTLCYQDYIDRVRQVLRDDGKNFIKDSEILEYVNDARLDLAWRYRAIKATYSSTFPDATGIFSLNQISIFEPEVLRITSTAPSAPAYEPEFVADDVWFSYVDVAQTPIRQIARYRPNDVSVYPAPPSGSTFKLDYIAKPALIAGTGDCDTLPDVLQRKAVAYARAQCKMKLNEVILAEMYDGQYNEGLPSGDANGMFTSRGPLQLIPLGNVFDADPEAAHR